MSTSFRMRGESRLKIEALPQRKTVPRPRLTRRRVLEAAVDLADRHGIESLSMRRLGQELGIEAMSLYTHVRSKDDLLAGMVEVVIGEIPNRRQQGDWKSSLRRTILSARRVMLRHSWAPAIIETLDDPGPAGLRHFDTVIGILREGGVSLELTHHALHLLGSRAFGFTQDLFDDSSDVDPKVAALLAQQIGVTHPYVAELAMAVTHEGGLGGCDTDVEFEFALDVILDSLERLRDAA
jgi:AcrR family transcriptional regulator